MSLNSIGKHIPIVILNRQQIDNFQTTVYGYFTAHKRDLPWRRTTDPYAILVSEIMLQQTQVLRVVEKYKVWIRLFPSVFELASAQLPDVLSAWSGLGYNRRALYLKQCAQTVATLYRGIFPVTPEALKKLPGIGSYTANAICVFAYNQPLPLLETNVRSVFIHHFFPTDAEIDDKLLQPLIDQTIDRRNPRSWFNALMDYGTYLKSLYPHLSHKSKQYTKQSPLVGSVREVRGWILKQLVTHSTITRATVVEQFHDHHRVDKALTSLITDQLIVNDNLIYRLR